MLEEEAPIPFDIHSDTMRHIPSFQIGVIRCKVGRVPAKSDIINSNGVLLRIDWSAFLSARFRGDILENTLVHLKWTLRKNKIRFWISDGSVTSVDGQRASVSQIKDNWGLLFKIDFKNWTVKGPGGEPDLGAGITWSRIEPVI